MLGIDWVEIAQDLIVFFVGGAVGWLFTAVLKLRRDVNFAFMKIRNLEDWRKAYGKKRPYDKNNGEDSDS